VDSFDVTLRKLAVRDDRLIHEALSPAEAVTTTTPLDDRSLALVRLGALIALDAGTPSYGSCVEDALHTGATREEVVAALVAVLPVVGEARVVSAAPKLALALGYDLDAALEASPGDG
jgi:4-carboxymuconolactone decarboxylase